MNLYSMHNSIRKYWWNWKWNLPIFFKSLMVFMVLSLLSTKAVIIGSTKTYDSLVNNIINDTISFPVICLHFSCAITEWHQGVLPSLSKLNVTEDAHIFKFKSSVTHCYQFFTRAHMFLLDLVLGSLGVNIIASVRIY